MRMQAMLVSVVPIWRQPHLLNTCNTTQRRQRLQVSGKGIANSADKNTGY